MDLSLKADLLRKRLTMVEDLHEILIEIEDDLDFYEEVFPDSDRLGITLSEQMEDLIENYANQINELDMQRLKEYNQYVRDTYESD